MLKKKQVISIVSIAIASFLIGTMFNIVTMASDGGNPFDAIWTAIYGLRSSVDSLDAVLTSKIESLNATLRAQIDNLNASLLQQQERVSNIEERANQVKTIRFYEPSETISPSPDTWEVAAIFIWTPNNITNNAILSIRCYCQFWSDPPPQRSGLHLKLTLEDEEIMDWMWFSSSEYEWTPILYYTRSLLYPNQSSYTFKFQFRADHETTGRVKDINVIMEVADGLPS